jgi:hypothetical protein
MEEALAALSDHEPSKIHHPKFKIDPKSPAALSDHKPSNIHHSKLIIQNRSNRATLSEFSV